MTKKNIECKNIGKAYGKKEVLHGISLTLEPNKIYGLIGRNGAGKTTLLSVMAAQNPAMEGEVLYGEEQVWENQSALDHICFSRELNAAATSGVSGLKVKDYLKTASIYLPYWDKAMEQNLIREFELDVKQRIGRLSKGMLSMVAIIVAMASKADYTFLDEPVAGLDVVMREYFYKLLLEEYVATGRTFVISTHIIEEAADIFEEVILLKDGNILLKDNTQELMERAFHISGKTVEVDAATEGLQKYQEEVTGRSKGVTVLLKAGEKIQEGMDVNIQHVSLQNLFIALCGKEALQ